ncbi:DUF423 domain-containing protein [Microvirgula aerodenitrificans]|uniref:DUF423 domain-containing protein n=1 Tax=Microvirgula aerodenitrificans TaxID=57480 RepID=UPI00248E19E0|nr:DUF423 domain-containing protein [Microvirgula aerodenitrificans]
MRVTVLAGMVLMFFGVAFGAFGAHALAPQLSPQQAGWWHTAVQYQFWHAAALIALAGLGRPQLAQAAGVLLIGTLLFCGTLYAMALGAPLWLGMVTPVGGTLLLIGWALATWTYLRCR